MENFEKHLIRQPVKTLPPEWRAEILSAARSGVSVERRCNVPLAGGFLTIAATPTWLANILWPHPKAWAGLAAVWLVIVGLQLAARDDSGSRTIAKASPPSPEMMAELKRQQRMFAELVGPREEAVADRRKDNLSRPRTRLEEVFVV